MKHEKTGTSYYFLNTMFQDIGIHKDETIRFLNRAALIPIFAIPGLRLLFLHVRSAGDCRHAMRCETSACPVIVTTSVVRRASLLVRMTDEELIDGHSRSQLHATSSRRHSRAAALAALIPCRRTAGRQQYTADTTRFFGKCLQHIGRSRDSTCLGALKMQDWRMLGYFPPIELFPRYLPVHFQSPQRFMCYLSSCTVRFVSYCQICALYTVL